MSNFRIGRHISIGGNFTNIPTIAKKMGYDIFQIFLAAPQQVFTKSKSQDDLTKFGQELVKYDIKMVIHGNYTINLCHPAKSKKYVSSMRSLVQDLMSSYHIGPYCLGVIIHMGKNISANNLSIDEAIDNYVYGIQDALEKTPKETTIILETGASQGSEVASRLNGLAEIYWKLRDKDRTRIQFCIDTCHIWASGYNISNSTGVKQFFKKFEDKIGIEKIICIHFNDSKTNLDSHVDRHADLGYGFIKSEGLRQVALFAKKHDIPLIMETPLNAINKKTNQELSPNDELDIVKLWLNDLKK